MTQDLTKLSVPALHRLLDGLVDELADKVAHAFSVLAELDRRGERHPLMSRGIFRWFREVDTGRLHPQALLGARAVSPVVKVLMQMPLERQRAITVGDEKVSIARFDADNSVVIRQEPFRLLSNDDLDLAFKGGKPRPEHGQRIVLARKAGPRKHVSKTKSRVVADVAKNEIIIGRQRFRPGELIVALQQLGYEVAKPKEKAA